MPKRESESGQMRKEDYEDQQNRRGGGPEVTQGFERADESVVSKRRMVSARRPKSASSGKTGAFANVSLTSGQTPGGGFSFGSAAPATTGKMPSTTLDFGSPTPAPAAAAAAAAAPKVAFSFGGASTPAPAPAPSVGFSLFGGGGSGTPGGTPAPAPAPFSFSNSFGGGAKTPAPSASTAGATPAPFGGFTMSGNSTTPTSGGSTASKLALKFQKHACALEKSFFDQLKQIPIKYTEMLPLLDRYLDHAYVLEDEYWKRVPKSDKAKPAASQDTGKSTAGATPFVSAKDSSASGSTPANLFGSASASKPTPASTGGGPFGGATPGTGSSNPFGASTFTGFGASPGAASMASFGTAASPPGGDAEDGTQGDTTASLEKGTADQDYSTLAVVETLHVFTMKAKLFVGTLKVQEHKVSKKRRMVMRDPSSGKVLLNMALPDEMTFSIIKNTKGKDIDTAIFVGAITPDVVKPELLRFRRSVGITPSLKDSFTGVGVNSK